MNGFSDVKLVDRRRIRACDVIESDYMFMTGNNNHANYVRRVDANTVEVLTIHRYGKDSVVVWTYSEFDKWQKRVERLRNAGE